MHGSFHKQPISISVSILHTGSHILDDGLLTDGYVARSALAFCNAVGRGAASSISQIKLRGTIPAQTNYTFHRSGIG